MSPLSFCFCDLDSAFPPSPLTAPSFRLVSVEAAAELRVLFISAVLAGCVSREKDEHALLAMLA